MARVPLLPRGALRRRGSRPGAIRSLDDVRRLPFTAKDDLRRHYPLGLLAVPRGRGGPHPRLLRHDRQADLRRLHPRTTSRPGPSCAPGSWSPAGSAPEHTVHIAFGYGLFTGGFGLHYGVEKVGAAVVPAAGGNTPRQVMLIQDLEADVLVCTPSLRPAHRRGGPAQGLDPDQTLAPLRPLRRRALDRGACASRSSGASASWPSTTTGSPRSSGPGVSGECRRRRGMHIAGGPLPGRVRRPGDARAGPRRRGGRAGLHHPHQGGHAGAPLPHPRHGLARPEPLPLRPHRRADEPRDGPLRRHAHHPRRERLPLADRGGAAPRRGHRARTTSSRSSRPGALDEVVVKVEVRPADFSDEMRQMVELCATASTARSTPSPASA